MTLTPLQRTFSAFYYFSATLAMFLSLYGLGVWASVHQEIMVRPLLIATAYGALCTIGWEMMLIKKSGQKASLLLGGVVGAFTGMVVGTGMLITGYITVPLLILLVEAGVFPCLLVFMVWLCLCLPHVARTYVQDMSHQQATYIANQLKKTHGWSSAEVRKNENGWAISPPDIFAAYRLQSRGADFSQWTVIPPSASTDPVWETIPAQNRDMLTRALNVLWEVHKAEIITTSLEAEFPSSSP